MTIHALLFLFMAYNLLLIASQRHTTIKKRGIIHKHLKLKERHFENR